jgi:hypothetical protein
MMRWLLRLYPLAFRRRYEDEILELLHCSARPRRDVLDVALHAGHLRLEQIMTNAGRHLANVALAGAIFLLGYTVNDLHGGITEIHRHGWSTAAVLLVVVVGALRASIAIARPSRCRGC